MLIDDSGCQLRSSVTLISQLSITVLNQFSGLAVDSSYCSQKASKDLA